MGGLCLVLNALYFVHTTKRLALTYDVCIAVIKKKCRCVFIETKINQNTEKGLPFAKLDVLHMILIFIFLNGL